jgi:hypothetical protein
LYLGPGGMMPENAKYWGSGLLTFLFFVYGILRKTGMPPQDNTFGVPGTSKFGSPQCHSG